MPKQYTCFKQCHRELFSKKYGQFIELLFTDMVEYPLFKGQRINGNDNNTIKCILQYMFWDVKGSKCKPCRCDMCGKNDGIIMGHIVSRDNGGTYNLQNLLWTCQSCEDKIGAHNITLKHIKDKSLLKKNIKKFLILLKNIIIKKKRIYHLIIISDLLKLI